jgi:hypothetical protein
MKIRNGFVSNSSSSSFCIVGQYYNESLLTEDIEEKINAAGLEKAGRPDDDKCVGLNIDEIAKYDISYSEFKKIVESKLKSIGLNANSVGIHTDGWYDG